MHESLFVPGRWWRHEWPPPALRMSERAIMAALDIERSITRIAHEILERNDAEAFALVGIRTRGVPLAERVRAIIHELASVEPPLGRLDINLYRDDLSLVANSPVIGKTEIDFRLEERSVVLVDDVLYTGRTTRAAMDALIEFGRPRRIQLAVLVDRGHRELPIRADYVGKNVPTNEFEVVHVRLLETDQTEQVVVASYPPAAVSTGARAVAR